MNSAKLTPAQNPVGPARRGFGFLAAVARALTRSLTGAPKVEDLGRNGALSWKIAQAPCDPFDHPRTGVAPHVVRLP